MALLKLVGVEKSFGGVNAVDGVDMEVGQEWVAVVGPNGAGKTTLVNIISGFVKPDRGRVLFKGVDVTRRGPAERVKMGIVRAFQPPSSPKRASSST
ncbi:ABC-type branched-chain amino acid transport systems, ATPase component [Pyrobaculum oguniense TE7]|uniref:ABC-type branched-chain amino acid transport systems, ATPase component n=1 Tax=Pyrobaculum oguniense (strain DSM 13380 / JCM 10595 / TE7) TaxID=698757 RepID=H6Q8N7_PYROT|nr:ABC-type branched-chain amino acid transport systems, ATPase component [Pyrobaculum oguniense TE7]